MKNKITGILLVLLLVFQGGLQAQQVRQQLLFNDNWKFHKGEVAGGGRQHFDDAGWRQLNLPHDWSIEGPFSKEWASGTGYLPGGTGWYRKTFTLPSALRSKKVWI